MLCAQPRIGAGIGKREEATMSTPNDTKICRRCKQPVIVNADLYDAFEQMHWLCFHLEYEHETDPDEACRDADCPWWHIEVLKGKLRELGVDPDQIIIEEVRKQGRF